MIKLLNSDTLRKDFPILGELIHGKKLIYFDNAATTQKPKAVLDTIYNYYVHDNANVHRGLHLLATRADYVYEAAREKVRKFINAKQSEEIIFVRGTTEAINLVAQSYGTSSLRAGDSVLVSVMEHHSNLIPWQLVRNTLPIKIHPIPIFDSGDIDLNVYEKLLKKHPRLVAISHVSNVLGTINPIKEMIRMAHKVGSLVLVDGAQAVAHFKVDVKELDADFYVFSGHKMYGPTGIGVLYAKEEILQKMPPYQGGGGMIQNVTFDSTEYADPPAKFEAGTPNISGAVALSAAIDYLGNIGMENIYQHEKHLLDYLLAGLKNVVGIKIIGEPKEQIGVMSFVMSGVHPHDVGTILDMDGIAIRAGHHCAMPLMERFKTPATARVSFGMYNTKNEVDIFLQSLNSVARIFKSG